MKQFLAFILVLALSVSLPLCHASADYENYDFSEWQDDEIEFLFSQAKEEMSKRGLAVPEQTSDDWNLQCTKCGKSLPDSCSFCLYCGTPLRSVGDSSTVLQTETGRAEIIGLLPVPAEFFSDKNADPSKHTIVAVKYTNFTDEARQFQKEFQVKAYQNGVELSTVGSYRSGVSQEVENCFKNVLLNGSITIGRAYVLDSTSDVTVIVSSSSKETVKAVYSLDGGTVSGNNNSKEDDTKRSEMLAQYADVISALDGGEWFFAGDEATVLNRLRFTQDSAFIGQVYYDGNGKHDNGERNYAYRVNDSDITLTLIDGSEFVIPYTLINNNIRLGNGDYLTLLEIEDSIQGHWMYREVSDNSYLGLKPTGHEYHIMINHGMLYSEYAAENVRESNGAYYYYGPEQGSYKLNFGGFDTNMRHGSEWFFSIADGQPVIMRYTHMCHRSDESSFPGKDGYSF